MVIKKKTNIAIFGSTSSIGNFLSRKYYLDQHNLLLCSNNKKKFNRLKKILLTAKVKKYFWKS